MPHREVITRGDLPHWYKPGAVHFVTYRLAGTLPKEVLRRLRAERDARVRQSPPPGMAIAEHRARAHKQFFAAYDQYLDQVSPIRWLANPRVAEMIVENLYHHHGTRYQLLEYAVMPNHVHVLFLPQEGSAVADAASIRGRPLLRARAEGSTDAGSVGHGDAAAGSVGHGDAAAGSVGHGYLSDDTDDAVSPLARIMHSLKSYTANEANKLLGRSGRFWQRESYDHWVRHDQELARIAEYIAANPVGALLAGAAWDWPYCSVHDRRKPRNKELAPWW